MHSTRRSFAVPAFGYTDSAYSLEPDYMVFTPGREHVARRRAVAPVASFRDGTLAARGSPRSAEPEIGHRVQAFYTRAVKGGELAAKQLRSSPRAGSPEVEDGVSAH